MRDKINEFLLKHPKFMFYVPLLAALGTILVLMWLFGESPEKPGGGWFLRRDMEILTK